LYYDSANAAGKMINEFPFKVFETISPPADNVRVYSVIFEPLLASWCPGTFSIYYNIIDKSGNQTGKTYLTGFTFNFDESDITIVEK